MTYDPHWFQYVPNIFFLNVNFKNCFAHLTGHKLYNFNPNLFIFGPSKNVGEVQVKR